MRVSAARIPGNGGDSPILVLGAPRSGTTWLAKIIDSHPDVVYRHEPDRRRPGPAKLTESDIPQLLGDWANDRSARTVTKRPFFAKDWQPGWARGMRAAIAGAVSVADRAGLRRLAGVPVPDLASRPAERLLVKSIDWAEQAAVLATALPASRTVFVLRHPCGQVSSVMRGNRQRRFDLQTAGTDMPFNETQTMAHAAGFGVDDRAFQALPDSGKYAWSWRAFNERAYAALAPLRNVHVVLYEALCAEPAAQAARILAFTGLDWNPQTEAFVRLSTEGDERGGYYSVYRNTVAAAESWRAGMPAADIAAVRNVAAGSSLVRFWPDLVEPVG